MDFDLKLVTVEDSYIEFLKRYQLDILPNKKEKSRHQRLYICVKVDDEIYSIPLCSPKENDYFRGGSKKDCLPIIRLVDKNTDLLGTLRLSHMLIVPTNAMQYYDISKERDLRYKELVTKEYHIIKSKQDRIRKNMRVLIKQKSQIDYFFYTNSEAPKFIQRTLDFKFIKDRSLEYAPALNGNYGVYPEIIIDEEEPVEKEQDFVMLDKSVYNKPRYTVQEDKQEEKFDLDEEIKSIREMVKETKVEAKKETLEHHEGLNANKIFTEPLEVDENLINSTKSMLVALRSIHLGNSKVDIVLNCYFRYHDIVYQIMKYDPKTCYALLKNCKTREILLVSSFPLNEECGWERPISLGNQEDSYERGLRIYNGFIK